MTSCLSGHCCVAKTVRHFPPIKPLFVTAVINLMFSPLAFFLTQALPITREKEKTCLSENFGGPTMEYATKQNIQ